MLTAQTPPLSFTPLQLQQDYPRTAFRFQRAAMEYLRTTTISIVLFTALATAAGTCLPLTTNNNLCANPPGTISSDGFDDVCVLVACCNPGNPITVEIPSGSFIACSDVNCTSVCDLSNMRSSLGGEACDSTCTAPTAPPNTQDCLGFLQKALEPLIPLSNLGPVLASAKTCLNDALNEVQTNNAFRGCLDKCKCAPTSLICAAQEETCGLLCAATHLPPSCAEYLKEAFFAALPRLSGLVEELQKVKDIGDLLAGALKCLAEPGPF